MTDQSLISVEQKTIEPKEQIAFAKKAASALMEVIESKPKKVQFNGETYLEFEDWQTVARFYQCSVAVEWTKPIIVDNKTVGWEARANTLDKTGQIISSADAACMRDEKNWKEKPEFQLRSMAQTRASAKSLRNAFAWVVTLGGFKPTPAEEMDEVFTNSPSEKSMEEIKSDRKASKAQIGFIIALMKQKNLSGVEVKEKWGIAIDDTLTSIDASFIIKCLK